jgi:hypothetical protein
MAVRFDGSDDDYSATTGLPTGNFTVTCWANPTTLRNPGGIFTLADSTASYSAWYWFGLRPDWAVRNHGANLASGVTPTAGTWWRLGLVLSGTTATLYGAQAGDPLTQLCSGTVTTFTPGVLHIGGTPDATQFWDGRVAALKVWSSALSAAQIETELTQHLPVATTGLARFHPFVNAETVDYSGNGRTLTAGAGAVATETGPPLAWGTTNQPRITLTPRTPTVDAGKDVFGTAGFTFSVQAIETGISITSRSWTVVSGPAEVATEIGTTSLLSWTPATAGVYELEYRVTNPAGQGYDTVYATVNSTGTIVATASISGATTTLTCNKPTGTAENDVLFAVQSGNFADQDLMDPPAGSGWQPLLAYDVGLDTLHVKGWTLTAGASEPSTYAFTQGTSSSGTLTIVAMRGVVEAGVRWAITADTSTTATRTCPTVEGVVSGSILLCGAMTNPGAARTWTPPTGMTEQADLQVSTATTHSVASLLNPSEPTGTKDFTLSGTTVAPGGIQWSAVFPMPYDPQRRGANKSMITFVGTTT